MREMKDSRIEWLGILPSNWNLTKISNLYTLRVEKVSDKDYMPLSVTMQGILPQLETAAKTNDGDNRKLVKKGDFAINSRSDRRGSCGISEYDGSVSLINTVLCPQNNMHPGYYNWLFHCTLFSDEFYRWGHGIVDDLWTTNWQDMKKITLPVPPLSEQALISDFLDRKCSEIDSLTADIEEQIDTLEQYKKSVITEAVTKGLDPDAEMKDSGVEWGEKIPKNWSLVKITHITDPHHPYSIGDGDHGLIKTEDYIEEGIPYIRVQNLGWCTDLQLDNVVYISEENNNRIKGSILRPGDILFVKTGATIGKTGIVPDDLKIANTTSHVAKLTVSKEYNPRYILYFLSSQIGYKQMWDIASQKTTRPELSLDEIKTMKVIVPSSKDEQNAIVDYLDIKCKKIDTIIADKEKEQNILAEYKKSLIYEYVTGKEEIQCCRNLK